MLGAQEAGNLAVQHRAVVAPHQRPDADPGGQVPAWLAAASPARRRTAGSRSRPAGSRSRACPADARGPCWPAGWPSRGWRWCATSSARSPVDEPAVAVCGSTSENCTPGSARVDGAELAAHGRRPVRLGIERLLLRMPAVQVEHDHLLGAAEGRRASALASARRASNCGNESPSPNSPPTRSASRRDSALNERKSRQALCCFAEIAMAHLWTQQRNRTRPILTMIRQFENIFKSTMLFMVGLRAGIIPLWGNRRIRSKDNDPDSCG